MLDRYLLVEKGANCGERHAVDGLGRMVLGRGRKAAIRLADPGLSREHCAFEHRGDEVWLVDLESKNGTSLNGLPAEEARLRSGDRVGVGQTVLIFVEEAPPAASGDVSVEIDSEVSETLSVSVERFFPSGDGDEGLERRVLHAVHQVSVLAQEEASIESFFAEVLAVLRQSKVIAGGVMALVDRAGALSERVTCPPGSSFALPSGVLESLLERRAVSISEEGAGRIVGVPLWIDRAVGGMLCFRLPDPAAMIPLRTLEILAVLGTLAGGCVETIRRLRTLERERKVLKAGAQARYDMVGRSQAMRRVFALIDRIAPPDATILIRGESGTGKELVARAIHWRSAVSGGPFVAVNAAALPIDLVESDLFGHEKGAFTGAVAAKQGRFELADGGTIFLDEIADLDPRVQPKFLRVLEDGTFQRVGGTRTLRTRTRVVAATNQDLADKVRAGTFREDLYYRLRVIEIVLPPLRERPEDVEHLAKHFLARLGEEMGRRSTELSPEILRALERHAWPGNVRELRNTIERALVLAGGAPIELGHLGFLASPAAEREVPTLSQLETDHIRRVLDLAGGNKSRAARLLGIDRSTLYEKLKDLGGDG